MMQSETRDPLPRCGMRVYIGPSAAESLMEQMASPAAQGRTSSWFDTAKIDESEIAISVKRCFYLDPDIIGFSCLSSVQAAKAAVMAMECGHLVLTTLDAETVDDAEAMLRELGVKESLWAELGLIHFSAH